MKRYFRSLSLVLLFVGLFAVSGLKAQDSSSMTGIVTDATGAVIPGTTVTLSNSLTGISLTQKTDSKGGYRFASAPPNEGYTVTFVHEGFSTVTVKNVTLAVGSTRTQDQKLVAGQAEQIEVSTEGITLNTTDASIGNNFDVKLLNELPIQNRESPAALFSLQPGVANSSVTGARTDQTSITLDGMDLDDIAAGSGLTGLTIDAPVDSVQEFRGTVAGLPPNLGTGSGGQFQLVTKNGSNKFHGLLYEYHRDTSTEANSWFLNNTGIPRTPLIRNQFGGNFGGPALKDKLFFFFDFNNSRIVQSGSTSRTVPLDSYRAGNVNYILNNPSCLTSSRLNTTPACIGTLANSTPNANGQSVTSLDPAGIGFSAPLLAFINQRYPHANDLTLGDGVNTGGYRFTQPTPTTLYNYVARIDYNLTPKQHIFGRMTIDREDAIQSLNDFPSDPLTSPFQDRSYGYVISHVWQIGQSKVNQFYYGDTISKYNFPNLYNATGALQYGIGGLSAPFTSGSSQKRRVPIPEVRDDFNWLVKAHNIGFGGTFKFIKTNSQLVNDFTGVTIGLGGNTSTLNAALRPTDIQTTGTTASGDYDSSFTAALGRIAALSSNYNYTPSGTAVPQGTGAIRGYRYYETELYVGDSWKVTKALTLTYGLRYQLYTVPYEVHGEESTQNQSFDSLFNARVAAGLAGTSGDTVVPFVTYNLGGKANNGPNLYKPSYKDLAPRIAFAFNPASMPKTVINGSAAIVYDRTVINAVNFIQDQSSFLFQNSTGTLYGQTDPVAALKADPRIVASTASKVAPIGLPASAPIPTAPAITKPYTPYVSGTSPYGGPEGIGYSEIVDPNLKDPYSITMNAGIQQEFPGNFILKINYAGRLGRRLLAQADAAQVVDFKDTVSSQFFSNAMAGVTQQLRNGVKSTAVTAQPWFENVVAPGLGKFYGYKNNTQFLAANFNSYFKLGDIADFNNALSEDGLIDTNVGVGAQFALNPWVTNKGFSSYHGLLVTLSKNFSQGVKFDFNYTWSHSMDNVSAPANYIAANSLVNFVCDATNLRECRGNSDFDVQQVVTSDFLVDLPFGRGRAFMNHPPRLIEELAGGWSISGTPQWRSGLTLGDVSNAFVASFNEDAPAIFNGNRGAVAAHVHKVGSTVQMFSNPTTADATFTGPIGLVIGSRNNLRGPSAFNMDAGLRKNFPIYADVSLKFGADFFNVLNHPAFGLPTNDITSGNFGVISSTSNTARVGQFSLRLEF